MSSSLLLSSLPLRSNLYKLAAPHVLRPSLLLRNSFHTSRLRLDVTSEFPEDLSKVPRVRRPGRFFAERLPRHLRIGSAPIYDSPAGSQVAFTKRSTLGFAALGAYVAYLCSVTTGLPAYTPLIGK